MSKISKQITAVIQNRRGAVTEPLQFADFSLDTSINSYSAQYLQQVAFTATFGCRYYIDEKLVYNNGDAMAEVLKNVRKNVIEEVFGEFRLPLRELRHHLYNRDYTGIEKALNTIESQMFDV